VHQAGSDAGGAGGGNWHLGWVDQRVANRLPILLFKKQWVENKTGGERGIHIESQDIDLLNLYCVLEFRYPHFIPTIRVAVRSTGAENVIY
jgi:hypothetical protein